MNGQCFIDGQWVPVEQTFDVTDPASGEVIGTAADAGALEATLAVDAASDAFKPWADTTARERSKILRSVATELRSSRELLGDLIVSEQGKPRGQAVWEVDYAADWFEWSAEEGRRAYGRVIPSPIPGKTLTVKKYAIGVTVAITPWNFPVAAIARKLAPALAAGCTCVVKPAEQTPLSAVGLFEVLERAGLPPGVANLVSASDPKLVAPTLLNDERVRKITFTGSTEVGKLLVEASSRNLARLSLELGGHAPFIVFDDADLDKAVAGLMRSKFQLNGQSCLCANRVFVQAAVKEEFQQRVCQAVEALEVGDGSDPQTEVGPLIDDLAVAKVTQHVEDALENGAKALVGGTRLVKGELARGNFFAPTVLGDVNDSMQIAREETFGPVLPLLEFQDEDDVVQRANDTRYGLGAYFYTQDLGRSVRVADGLDYGMVGVNDPLPATPEAPFGGFKESGLGREGGQEGVDSFLEPKLISVVV